MSFQLPTNRQAESSSRSRAKIGVEIQQRLAAYKNAKALDAAYYTRVVREAPARAVDMLLYKDMLRDEEGTLLVDQVMPELTKLFAMLDQEAKARIDTRVRQADQYRKATVLANETLREIGRFSRRIPSKRNEPTGDQT